MGDTLVRTAAAESLIFQTLGSFCSTVHFGSFHFQHLLFAHLATFAHDITFETCRQRNRSHFKVHK